jgi:hypothetical protein
MEVEQKVFHTVMARLLYLSKRASPGIMMLVAFLCTRVTKAMVEDHQKLKRVLGYLKRMADYTLTLKQQDILWLEVYLLAAFTSYIDSKS